MWSVTLIMLYELVPEISGPYKGNFCMRIITQIFSRPYHRRRGQPACAPVGAVTLALILIFVPLGFPNQGNLTYKAPLYVRNAHVIGSLACLDGPGCFLILSATMLIVAVLLEGGTTFEWNSAVSIVLFVVSGILWILFMVNEWYLTKRDGTLEPIFPWRFLINRVDMGVLISSFLSGLPYNILIITIPQRFQELGGASPIASGIRLIPFNALIPAFGVITNFAVLPEDGTLPSTIYGCQVLAGLGAGVILSITLLLTGIVVEPRDIAVSSGALIQFRALGGVLGISITTAAFNSYLRANLQHLLRSVSASDLLAKVQEIHHLSLSQQLEILVVAMIYRRGDQVKLIDEPAEEKSKAQRDVLATRG
ncbi:hypothetical protein GQ44DRAFT_727387 [Phaeosphaeriaceae sp. PMI808]|nr:hypothetical protein GQ44DRAFT_727387 [Phaeosphaeriaceae sp. PMI808]